MTMNETKEAIQEEMTGLLFLIHVQPLKLQSDLARAKALYVAALASKGFISSICPVSKFPNGCWRVTQKGLKELEEQTNKQLGLKFC